jgi:RNA polymerase sigma-70 factor (ECF subfamily)
MNAAEEFMAMYVRERERLMVFLVRRTFDVPLAADMAAETFAVALRQWEQLSGRSEEEQRAWLFTVARRQLSRYLRRLRVERRAIERLGIEVPVLLEDDVAKIESLAEISELRAAIGHELARLSVEQRDALKLRIVEERSYEEVARVLGVSEQTARARVSRGLRALAAALEGQHELLEASE